MKHNMQLEFDKDMILMELENAELKHIERIVAMSKAAFDNDINVGASEPDAPPDYDSIAWHIQMKNEGHLLQAVIDGEIVGGAILFLDKDERPSLVPRNSSSKILAMRSVSTSPPEIRKPRFLPAASSRR